ncbi:DUF6456 domain-containing protein [Cohaesibacter celericrescens]|uniref:DUF6456 domain-containing protein n=1 Tax=Cohaesibacter celericrescens TaxID=2067669 RepID=UPI0035665CD2
MIKSKATTSKRGANNANSSHELASQEMHLLKQVARNRTLKPVDVDAHLLTRLLKRGAVEQKANQIRITSAGKQALRRMKLAQDEEQIYASQHQRRETITTPCHEHDGPNIEALAATGDVKSNRAPSSVRMMNRAESPLALLASKKRSDGSAYLSPSQYEAGERLRSEFERGRVAPSMGINWDRLGEVVGSVSKNARIQKSGNDLSDSALGAQYRFRKAIDYVGEEFAGALIDFCCFLKGLEEIERTRQWPARSAKQILALALSRLARHYGLSDMASGPVGGPMRHWGADDYRPKL